LGVTFLLILPIIIFLPIYPSMLINAERRAH